MSALDRHPWSQKFQHWLRSQSFEVISTKWERAGGTSELLELGRPQERDRQAILFLHGLGNDALFPNIDLFRHCLTSGFNIITADLDGHGQGLTSVFSEKFIDTLVAEMVAKSKLLLEDDRTFHVCGYSLGGALALQYAVQNPNRVRTATAIGMPVEIRVDLRMAYEFLTPALKSFRNAIVDYGPWGIHPAIGPILRHRYPVRQSPNETASYMEVAGRILRRASPESLLKTIQCPTLYIAGSRDFIAYQEPSAKFLDSLSGRENFSRQLIPGETHFSCMLTPKTARFVADFVAKDTLKRL